MILYVIFALICAAIGGIVTFKIVCYSMTKRMMVGTAYIMPTEDVTRPEIYLEMTEDGLKYVQERKYVIFKVSNESQE